MEPEYSICEFCNRQQSKKTFNDQLTCKLCYTGLIFTQTHFPQMTVPKGFYSSQINEIIPQKLYLGNNEGAHDLQKLNEFGITDILIVGTNCPINIQADKLIPYYPNKFNYMQIKIQDTVSEDIKDHFQKAIEFIENGKVVYVHCFAGVSRSASVVIAYLIVKNNMTYQDSFRFVKERREQINPNTAFQEQLEQFQTSLKEQN